MDTLLAPLDELTSQDLIKDDLETKIPIPNPAYLKKKSVNEGKAGNGPLLKYAKEYDEFCKWASLPKDVRRPKTALEWERQKLLPRGYSDHFKARDDFSDKRLAYFWDWMMDLYPDVVYAVYRRAKDKSSKDAGIFIDLLSKKMKLDAPRLTVAPMILVGVPQDKIDNLFVPKEYHEADLIPDKEVKIVG